MEGDLNLNALGDSLVYLTLSQAISQDASVLKPAEEKLCEWETHPGFYSSLAKIVSSRDVDVPIRWLATVCLKNGIDKYWWRTVPNQISDTEKSFIRSQLVKCFDEPVDVIALQLAVLVARISRRDWPREWPDLIAILVNNMKSNDNDVLRHRSLLILSHVVKTLSTKKLAGDRKLFNELTLNIYPIMYEFWNYSVDKFLSATMEEKKNMKFKCELEMSMLCAKILLKLTVYGFNKPETSPEAMNFISMIFERTKTLLQFRLTLRDDDSCKELVEKHVLTIIKVLFSVLEVHVFSFVDFVQITLQCSFYYCFTKEGSELLFDTLLIRWLNLMKAILLCPEYNAPAEDNSPVMKVKMAKAAFFTQPIAHEIFYKLINEYFILTEKDLNAWDADPEGYAAEEIGESWKYNLKPCIEGLFKAILNRYKDLLLPIIVHVIENSKPSPNPDDMTAILKKDAVYNIFGLSIFDLFDEIDSDKWFSEVLLPEMRVKAPNYRILRRRIAWLIGRWTCWKLRADLFPVMYSEIINLLEPEEDIAVRLTAANTIKDMVDDFDFKSDVFLEYIPRCFQLLYTLLEQSKECETKMQVLTLLSFIIERVGWEIAPFFESLVNYLPLLWQHSSGHNMLRCAIVTVLTQIVNGLGDQCITLEKFIILVVEFGLDTKQEGYVYLLEDSLHLLSAYVDNVTNSEEILTIFPYLPIIIEKSTEHLELVINIVSEMLVLSPDTFLHHYGVCIIQSLLELMSDMKSEGIIRALDFFEICIKMRPYKSVEMLSSFLQDSLFNLNIEEDKPILLSYRLSIIARIILTSNELFAQLVESASNKRSMSRDAVFASFLDSWLHKMNIIWPPDRQKLIGLCLVNLLTAGSSIVLARFSLIFGAIAELLADILTIDADGVVTDSLCFGPEENNPNADTDLKEQKTGHHIRHMEITLQDPIHKVDLRWYFQSQLEELRRQIGAQSFEQLMKTVTEDTLNLIKEYSVFKNS